MTIKAKTKVTEKKLSIPEKVADLYSWKEGGTDNEHPYLNLKYFDYDYQCFSELDKDDLRSFTDVSRKFSMLDWVQLKRQSGKGTNKTGLAPTIIPRHELPRSKMIDKISEDIDFIEMRLNIEARMFGFRSGAAFFLVLLDKNHDIT